MMTTATDEQFTREVLASSVPVFVHFRAPWCGICNLVSPVLSSFQASYSNQVRVVDINADENLVLTNRYDLKTLPTVLCVENGKVIQRIEGFKSRESLKRSLESVMQRYRLEDTFSISA